MKPKRPPTPDSRLSRRYAGLDTRFWTGLLVVLVALTVPILEAFAQGGSFKVIVHVDNPTASMDAKTLSKVFQKKKRKWDHGETITAYDLESESPAREAFTRDIHGKSISAIQSYWQRKIFAGKDKPPDEVASDAEMMARVAEDPGAVGYVSGSTSLAAGVKELTISE